MLQLPAWSWLAGADAAVAAAADHRITPPGHPAIAANASQLFIRLQFLHDYRTRLRRGRSSRWTGQAGTELC